MRLAYGYAAVAALVAAQIAYFYGRLPDSVASHFGGNGMANGYMTRAGFVKFYVGLLLFVALTFGLVSFAARAIPVALINVPNKERWFSGERESESRAWLARELLGFGLVVMLFLVAVTHRVFMANVDGGRRPCMPTPYLLTCMGGLLAASLVMAFRTMRRFS
jgi:hypothetical protein